MDETGFYKTIISHSSRKTVRDCSASSLDVKRTGLICSLIPSDTWEEVDGTGLLPGDFSIRRGLSQPNLMGFAISITENDLAHFHTLHGTDFQAPSSGSLELIDERLLKFGDGIKSCVTTDAKMIEPVIELTKHLISLRNFASATASLAALESAKIRPPKLSKFRYLTESKGNYYSYRLDYLRAPALPCPTPHVRELKQTQQPYEVMADILKYKLYRTSIEKKRQIDCNGAPAHVISHFQTCDMSCLVCRQRPSEYDGLRLKCAECYRRERISKHLDSIYLKDRKHEQGAPAEEEPLIRGARVVSTNSKEMKLLEPQISEAIMPMISSSGSFPAHIGSQLGIDALTECSMTPTPPRTLQNHIGISLPHINEFDGYITPSRANGFTETSGMPLLTHPFGTSRGTTERFPYSLPSVATSTSNNSTYGNRYLPLPKAEAVSGHISVNQVLPASSLSQEICQCSSSIEPASSAIPASVRKRKHSVQSGSDSKYDESQLCYRQESTLKDTSKQLSPFCGQIRPSWMQQPLYSILQSFNNETPTPKPNLSKLSMLQVADASSSTVIRDKGKRRLVLSSPETYTAQSRTDRNESFEESIRSTAKFTMGLVNIHNPK